MVVNITNRENNTSTDRKACVTCIKIGWSAPSAIGTGGIGAGGQIGAELTDFVLVLNTKEAVKTFSQVGNVTLGGNVSGLL